MSDTPETDKNTWSDSSDGVLCNVVTADFAKRLERERDKAREQNSKLRDIANQAIEWLSEHEGDHSKYVRQLRAELDQLKNGAK